jgi:uncharacterized protein
MDRNKLLKILDRQVDNKNIIKHMLATEACMGALWDHLKEKQPDKVKETKEEWMMAGLMHDGDYKNSVPAERQGVEITKTLMEEGVAVSDSVAHAMAAHNAKLTKVEPESLMDWSIFCVDSLTGLIVATTLVLPEKKLSQVTVERVLNRFKEKAFARGTRRDEIGMCEDKLNIPIDKFVGISLKAMQKVSSDLGL